MVYYKIEEPNGNVKYIKSINGAEGTLEFQDTNKGAYCRDEGFFADTDYNFIKFHFTEKYPELQYMIRESTWNANYELDAEGVEDGDAPVMAAVGNANGA